MIVKVGALYQLLILFFVPILCCLLLSLKTLKRIWALIGLSYGCLYLLFGIVQHNSAKEALGGLLRVGHQIERMEIKPSLGNNLLWRIQYQYNQKYYIDAVHIPWFGSDMTIIRGEL